MDELGKPGAFGHSGYMVRISLTAMAGRARCLCNLFRFLPLIPNFTRPAPYDKAAIEAGKAASLQMLDSLEEAVRDREYLVGNWMTLADIFVAVFVSRGLEWVLGEEWRGKHPCIMRHVMTVVDWDPVKAVIPNFVFIGVETPNRNPLSSAST